MIALPIWFLILALFLPRLALYLGWSGLAAGYWVFPFHQPWSGVSWMFFPRLLTVIMVYTEFGATGWFWLHLATAVLVFFFGGSGASSSGKSS